MTKSAVSLQQIATLLASLWSLLVRDAYVSKRAQIILVVAACRCPGAAEGSLCGERTPS